MGIEKYERDIKSTIYPILYHDFKAQGQDGESDHLMVEDLTESMNNFAIEFLVKYHELSEEFADNFNTKNADGTDKAPRVFYREILDKKLSLICKKPGSREPVAVNMLVVKTKDQIDDISKVGRDVADFVKWVNVNSVLRTQSDDSLFAADDVHFLQCVGLVIHPDYRDRQDFISELMKAQLIFLPGLENVNFTSTEVFKVAGEQAFDIERIMRENPTFKFEMRQNKLISRKVWNKKNQQLQFN